MASSSSLSLQRSRSTSTSNAADHLSSSTTWSDEQEARLQFCEAELRKAQKRWSASQDLWIEEYRRLQDCEKQVDHLLDLKKAHFKLLKKQQGQAKKAVGIWKKRTWRKGLSRTSSKMDATAPTPPDEDDADDEGVQDEEEAEEDGLAQIERTDSIDTMQKPPRRPSLAKAVRRLSIPTMRHRRKTSTGDTSTGPSACQSEVATPSTMPNNGFFV